MFSNACSFYNFEPWPSLHQWALTQTQAPQELHIFFITTIIFTTIFTFAFITVVLGRLSALPVRLLVRWLALVLFTLIGLRNRLLWIIVICISFHLLDHLHQIGPEVANLAVAEALEIEAAGFSLKPLCMGIGVTLASQ